MKSVKFIAPAFVIGSLAACGSSSGTPGNVQDALDLIDRVDAGVIEEVETSDLPETAEMAGFVGVAINDGEDDEILFGSVSVTADFGAGALTGTADGFSVEQGRYDADDNLVGTRRIGSLNGELDVTGTITGTAFDVDMNGELSGRLRGNEIVADVTLGGSGEFFNLDGTLTALSDDITGSAIVSAGGETEILSLDDGVMILEE